MGSMIKIKKHVSVGVNALIAPPKKEEITTNKQRTSAFGGLSL